MLSGGGGARSPARPGVRRSATDVPDWDPGGPQSSGIYQPPAGARASRRVAGAAPEVQLKFGAQQRPIE